MFWRGLLKSFPYVCARFARRLFIIYNCHKISVSTAHESHLPPHNIILWFRQKCFFKFSVGRELVVGHNEKYFSLFHRWRVESQFKSIYCWFFSLHPASIQCLLLKYERKGSLIITLLHSLHRGEKIIPRQYCSSTSLARWLKQSSRIFLIIYFMH